MLVACWSVKGGVGTTVVAASLALLLARDTPGGAVLADLAGDAPAVLGLPEPTSPGLAGWLSAGAGVPVDALARLEIEVAPGVALLPRGIAAGSGAGVVGDPGRAGVLAAMLDRSPRPAVVDCGRVAWGAEYDPVAGAIIDRAPRSLLVTRPCYMALRRAMQSPLRRTGIVLVDEPGHVLTADDIAGPLKAPVVAEIPLDLKVARLVDSGMLSGRLPHSLDPLRHVA